MATVKPLIGVLDAPGHYRDALAETIACDGLAVLAAERFEDLPAETALVVAHAQAVPSQDWARLTARLPTIVVAGSRLDANLLTAVDVGLLDYVVEPMRHGELLRRMIRKAIEMRQLENARERERERVAQLNAHLAERNVSVEGYLALLRQDQQSGRQVQRKLLPSHPQTISGISCDYWMRPSLYLSGDFLDFHGFNDRYTLFYFADVSGHGASSALVTVLLKYLFNRWLSEWDAREVEAMPARWLTLLNRELLDINLGKHATLFVGVVDRQTHQLHYSLGAQLPKPLLVAGGSVQELPGEGMPVGLFPNVEYPRLTYGLPENFRLWLCSDGILDCLSGETLDRRLKELERRVQRSTSLERLRDSLMLEAPFDIDVEGNGGGRALPDDLTIMVLSGFAK